MNCFGYLQGVNGIKTGFTNGAGRCLVTSVSRDDFDIIVVVLGADTKKIRTRDSIKLIEYIYKNYELINLEDFLRDEFEVWQRINENRINVYKGENPKVNTTLGDIKYSRYPVLKDDKSNIWTDVEFTEYFEAPVQEKTQIGKMKMGVNATDIMEVEILASNRINKKNVYDYFVELIKMIKKANT